MLNSFLSVSNFQDDLSAVSGIVNTEESDHEIVADHIDGGELIIEGADSQVEIDGNIPVESKGQACTQY